MAAPQITNIQPYFSNPASQSSDGANYVLRYKVMFNLTAVRTASPQDLQLLESRSLDASFGGISIPQYNDAHPYNNAARCSSRSTQVVTENNKPTQVIVTCNFTTQSNDNRDEEEDPLNKAPDVNWHVIFEREVIQNADLIRLFQDGQQFFQVQSPPGNPQKIASVNEFILPVANSASDPFNPFPERDVPYLVATVTRNIPKESWDPKEAASTIGSINNAQFTLDGATFDKETAQITDRKADIKYTANFSYRQEKISLLFKDTHDVIIQDRGFEGYEDGLQVFGTRPGIIGGGAAGGIGGAGNPVPGKITFKVDGEDNPQEVLMNGFGNRLPGGEKPVYLHFRYLRQINFNQLNLPQEKL